MRFMNWNECEREFIRNIEIDNGKIDSIKEAVSKRHNFVKSIKADKNNASFVVENYYEIIKELLVALLLKKGLKSKNHQCLISYFYNNYPDNEADAHLIQRLSYLRNRLNYYGELIEIEFYEKNKEDFERIINLLKKYIK